MVAAGDAKVDNHKYKEQFGAKAKMLSPDEVAELVGHGVGGVCPFGIKDGVKAVSYTHLAPLMLPLSQNSGGQQCPPN